MEIIKIMLISCLFSYLVFALFFFVFVEYEMIARTYQHEGKKLTLSGIGFMLKMTPRLIFMAIGWPITLYKFAPKARSS